MIDRREQLRIFTSLDPRRARLGLLVDGRAAEVLGLEVMWIGALGLQRRTSVLILGQQRTDHHIGLDARGLDQSIVGRVVERGRELDQRPATELERRLDRALAVAALA